MEMSKAYWYKLCMVLDKTLNTISQFFNISVMLIITFQVMLKKTT